MAPRLLKAEKTPSTLGTKPTSADVVYPHPKHLAGKAHTILGPTGISQGSSVLSSSGFFLIQILRDVFFLSHKQETSFISFISRRLLLVQ
jgi:hypothetical protein